MGSGRTCPAGSSEPPVGTIGGGGGVVSTTQSTAVRSSDGASTGRGTGTGGAGNRRKTVVVLCWRNAAEESRGAGSRKTNNPPQRECSEGEERPSDQGPSRGRLLLPRSTCCMGAWSFGTASGDPGHQCRHPQGQIDPEKKEERSIGVALTQSPLAM